MKSIWARFFPVDTAKTLQDREHLYRALDDLGTQIEARVQGPRAAELRAREKAYADYQALVDLKTKSERTWPPLHCDTDLADRYMASAKADEKALPTWGRTVREVNHYLERIAQSYASLSNEVQSEIKHNNTL